MNDNRPRVFFAHGLDGTPWGSKIKRMARVAEIHGFQVESPDYTGTRDPDERVRILLERCTVNDAPLVLAGSSMGSYLSIIASQALQPTGLFLLAPAVYLPGYAVANPVPHRCPISIVHGWQDEVVPVSNAIRFARAHGSRLHLVKDGHRLLENLFFIETVFAGFLRELLQPPASGSDDR